MDQDDFCPGPTKRSVSGSLIQFSFFFLNFLFVKIKIVVFYSQFFVSYSEFVSYTLTIFFFFFKKRIFNL